MPWIAKDGTNVEKATSLERKRTNNQTAYGTSSQDAGAEAAPPSRLAAAPRAGR